MLNLLLTQYIMKITFIDPVQMGLYNPSHPSDFSKIPDRPGIYIHGFKIFIGIEEKFVPIYVGNAKDLRGRIGQHYFEEKMWNGNSKKEVFSFRNPMTLKELNDVYTDMAIYNSYKGSDINRFSLNSLVWFNNSRFFDFRLGLPEGTSKYVSNSGHSSSINDDFEYINSLYPNQEVRDLRTKIIETQFLYNDRYCFVFATLDKDITVDEDDKYYNDFKEFKLNDNYFLLTKHGPGRRICEIGEHATKTTLDEIGIHTTAKSVVNDVPVNVDLRNVQDILVNTGNHNYGNTVFNKPLIITI